MKYNKDSIISEACEHLPYENLKVNFLQLFENKIQEEHKNGDTSPLHGYIMELRGFIRNSTFPHPNFGAVKQSLLDLFMDNAKILQDSHRLSEYQREGRFIDSYTNMTSDLEEARIKYIDMERE